MSESSMGIIVIGAVAIKDVFPVAGGEVTVAAFHVEQIGLGLLRSPLYPR